MYEYEDQKSNIYKVWNSVEVPLTLGRMTAFN